MPVALSTGRKHSLSRFPSKSTFAAADFFVLALCQSSGWAAASSTSCNHDFTNCREVGGLRGRLYLQGDVENPIREDIYGSTKTLVFHAAGTLYLDVSQSGAGDLVPQIATHSTCLSRSKEQFARQAVRKSGEPTPCMTADL